MNKDMKAWLQSSEASSALVMYIFYRITKFEWQRRATATIS